MARGPDVHCVGDGYLEARQSSEALFLVCDRRIARRGRRRRRKKKEEGGAEGSFSVFTQQKKKDDSSIIVIIIILCVFFSAEKPSSLAMADAVDLSALTLEDYKENGAPSLPISEDLSQENGEPSLPISEDISQEAEHSKLFELMRSNLQKADPSCEESDNATLERFLATNSWDPKKASEALVDHFKWWHTFAPLGYIPEDEIIIERKKGKLCLQGHDKKGRTIGVFLIARHDAFDRNLEEFKRYIVYSFEKAVSSTKNESKQMSVIVDLAGWGYKSVDVRGYLALLDILQDHYINHLGKMILIHVPFIFWAAWKVTSPFFNEFTKERMIFVEDKNLHSALLNEIDEDQLPDIYGGKMPLDPV